MVAAVILPTGSSAMPAPAGAVSAPDLRPGPQGHVRSLTVQAYHHQSCSNVKIELRVNWLILALHGAAQNGVAKAQGHGIQSKDHRTCVTFYLPTRSTHFPAAAPGVIRRLRLATSRRLHAATSRRGTASRFVA